MLSEASSTSTAHYSCLFALTSSTLQKPEDQYESNANAKLKKIHPNTGGRDDCLFRIILTQSYFHYPSTVTVTGVNKNGTNSIEQQSEERKKD